jgi:acyl carrier protein
MDELMLELKRKIVASLKLEGVVPEQIDSDAPLFGAGLGLDSIDALELVVMLEREYGIVIKTLQREIWVSVRTLAEFVRKNRAAAGGATA